MKTKTINLYQFSELSEDAKQKAISNLCDINIDYEWWNCTYDDASNIGLKITGFDIDRGSYVNGEFIDSALSCAHKIESEHGETCETWKTAKQFINDFNTINLKYENDEINEDEAETDEEDLNEEFLKSLCEDYRIILRNEYGYLTSEEAIIETIESNEYDFTEDGKLA